MPGSVLAVRQAIALDQVRKELANQAAKGGRPMIYYGARTCWWTHRATDLRRGFHDLPVDVRGGVLLQTDYPERFLSEVGANAGHYGRHGVEAFLAAHNDNAIIALTGRPWCEETWDAYNEAIDAAIGRGEWKRDADAR